MKWKPGGRSRNLEDRRGVGRPSVSRGQRRLPAGGPGKLGLGGTLLLVGVLWAFGADPMTILGVVAGGGQGQVSMNGGQALPGPGTNFRTSPEEEALVDFVSFVLDDAQKVWQAKVDGYPDAKLVLFRRSVRSACGNAQSAMGPFYCPGDHKVYIDLGFYEDLRRRFGAPGDFAQAYVLAHEIGHHVQSVVGTEAKMRKAQRANPSQANALSVRMELQADCYAGVWAHSTAQRDLLERGDLDEGIEAAAAVGDDRIQEMSGRNVSPESFTHGSSQQRRRWFRRGFETGDPGACDTFAAATL